MAIPQPKLAGLNPITKLFMWWLNRIFAEGRKRQLEMSDLYQTLPKNQSKYLCDNLSAKWEQDVSNCKKSNSSHPGSHKRPSLMFALIRQFGKEFGALSILIFVEECFTRIAQPICLGYLINYFNQMDSFNKVDGYYYAVAVASLSGFYCITHHLYGFRTQVLGMKFRIACSSLVYRKSLRLSQGALLKTNVGMTTNLLANDLSRFDGAILYLAYLWVAPLQTGIIIYILWGIYGYSCLAGLAILGIFVGIQGYTGKLSSKLRSNTAIATDKRIGIMKEIMSGIHVIKMYAWEKPFGTKVNAAREDEVKIIKKSNTIRCFNSLVSFTASKIIIFAILFTYVFLGNVITAEKVFVSLALVNILRYNITFIFATAMLSLAEVLVSIRRVEKFLLMEEKAVEGNFKFRKISLKSYPGGKLEVDEECNGNGIEPNGIWINNLTAKWEPHQSENTLSDLSLSVKEGEILGVIGRVGSGKSSLLQAILRELADFSNKGNIAINGSIAYVPQEAWVFGGSLRDNILFGKEFKAEWYDKVIEACALRRDIELLPHGDLTLVGERGVCLSGGQKARLTLARGVYANADIYLLDDPLSALDLNVGRHIFENCICGILAQKTRILVTHQLQFLESIGDTLVLEGGRVKARGNFRELLRNEKNLSKLISSSSEESCGDAKSCESALSLSVNYIECQSDIGKILPEDNGREEDKKIDNGKVDKGDPQTGDESRSDGVVEWSAYWNYFRAGSGVFGLTVLLLLCILMQILLSGSDLWLTFWIETQDEDYILDGNCSDPFYKPFYTDNDVQAYSYCGIIASLLLCSLLRTLLYRRVCMRASANLHDKMFSGIVRAPMRFFEVNPLGRLLNRLSKDIGSVDELLPTTCLDVIDIGLSVVGILIVTCMMNPILLVPSTILLILSYLLRGYYLKTATSVKRLEGTARSPVFSHLSTSLSGLTIIRAFGVEEEFCRRFDELQDLHTSSWYISIGVIRWLAIWLDWMFVVFMGIVIASFMLFSKFGDGAQVGLAVSSVMTLTGMLQWGVKQSAEVETQMVAVERVLEYANISPEPPLESHEDKLPPKDWPQRGEIRMDNVELRYSPQDTPVLKGISCVFKSRDKIGIVGRTGAGKSSLITTLFRLSEPSGVIEIDGIDILSLGLHDLRSKISIIPQDPVLFTGSLRKNLDPFEEYNDEEVWRVLEEIQLAKEVKLSAAGLMMEVAESGSNFSVGQRQLICLGRAILRNNKILVMDEATANLDNETDALIQRTIRTKFVNSTVLTIAHRLHTVMDSDKILVLDAGRIKEYDEPFVLLQDSSSSLHSLVKQMDSRTGELLHKIAEEAYRDRRHMVETVK